MIDDDEVAQVMAVLMISLTIFGLEEGQDVNSPHNVMSVNIKLTLYREVQ